MSLSEKIQSDLVTAMKAKDDFRLSVLRMVKAAIQLKEVEKIRKLEDNESIQLLQTLLKQRKESIEQFNKGGRPELAEKEQKEAAIIEEYLPAVASREEMHAAISKAIAVSDFSPPESRAMFCKRLPGGEAMMSIPLSAKLASSVSRISPWPPPNSVRNI